MHKYRLLLLVVICNCILFKQCECAGTRIKIRFPYGGPFVGMVLALALPLDLENYDVFVSINFEANYVLPANETFTEYPSIVERKLDFQRKYVYDAFEYKLKSHGYPGKECLLRAICESAEYSLANNGVLADIVHIIFTPSTSKLENLLDYENAEIYGKLHKHCKKYKKKCSYSILDMISWIGDIA